jgi:hypothetical protein
VQRTPTDRTDSEHDQEVSALMHDTKQALIAPIVLRGIAGTLASVAAVDLPTGGTT